jgi:hypothetical protein
MAGDLSYEYGLPLALQYGKANLAGNATTLLTLTQGGAGFVVPTGYKFHPMLLHAEVNAAVQGGSGVVKVTANTTALTGGPSVTLNANTQTAVATARVNADPIAAGKVVALNIVQDANFAPNTLDIDAVLVGVLLPA